MKTIASLPVHTRLIGFLLVAHVLLYGFVFFARAGVEFPFAAATVTGLALLLWHDYAPHRGPRAAAARVRGARPIFTRRSALPLR
jgi:hypothetical protein